MAPMMGVDMTYASEEATSTGCIAAMPANAVGQRMRRDKPVTTMQAAKCQATSAARLGDAVEPSAHWAK